MLICCFALCENVVQNYKIAKPNLTKVTVNRIKLLLISAVCFANS